MAVSYREHEIGESYETGEALRNATQQAEERGFYDFVVFDADAHHYDAQAWAEISDYLENPILRYRAKGGEYGERGLPALSSSSAFTDPGRKEEYGHR